MIHLTYSNRTEALLDALAADLGAARARGRSPFERVRVVVPNRNVETWLKHGLARRMGIAANLEILLLRRFVGGLIQQGIRDEEPMRLVDGAILQDLLLSLFLDEEYLEGEELARVRSYLHAAGDGSDAVDLRRLQLATELARLFEEYGFSRPEMLAAWPREPLLSETPFAGTERWQRRLWIDLFGEGGLAQRRDERLVHLPQVLEQLAGLELGDGSETYLFGVSYFASAFHRVLARLASGSELRVYTLNPCMEFWEDVEAGHEARKRLSKRMGRSGEDVLFQDEDPFGLTEDDTPALSLWGRPGRENIRLLNALTDCDFRAAFEEVEGTPTLLRQLQQDILVRQPRRSSQEDCLDFSDDRSVQILAAPGVRRECESIAEEIWRLVHEDASSGREPLRFNEIAVLVAGSDPQSYFTHLAAVFEESFGIPFNRTGSAFAAESRIAEAIELLLALPSGGFSRAEILAFLTHPNVIGAYPDADPADWARFCERLGIVRGADVGDLEGSYVEGDLLSWRQGIRRMALGSFLSGDEIFELGPARYLPEELPAEALGSFGALAAELIDQLDGLRSSRLPTAAWGERLAGIAERHVHPKGPSEERDLERCLRALRGLAAFALGGREVGYRLASELALQALRGLSGSRGQYLADGVVVSTLQPMRAIPFRAIFIAGLGQGRFPAAERHNSLDLRLARPRAGDINPREGEQYMFLEALLCARDSLFLSYVARDQLTGDELLPSPVLVELERMLEQGYGATSLQRTIPLRRFDAPGEFASIEALREARTLAIREELRSHLGERPLPAVPDLLASLGGEARARLEGALGLGAIDLEEGSISDESDEPIRISRHVLRKFLEDPLQGSATYLLGLRDEEEDPGVVEDEALSSNALLDSQLLARSLIAVAAAGLDELSGRLEERYDAEAERLRLAGVLPTGFFGERVRDAHLETLQKWGASVGETGSRGVEVIRFGKAQEEREGETSREALTLEVEVAGRTRRVEIGGATEPLVLEKRGSLILKTLREPRMAREASIRAFLDHVLLAASGAREKEAPHTAFFVPSKKGPVEPVGFAAVSQREAVEYLSTLVSDLFSRVHDYLLPIGVVLEQHASGDLAAALAKLALDPGFGSYGPVRNPSEYEPPPEEDAAQMIERRFGLFLRSMQAAGGRA